jgi:hypothetical protein
MKTPKQIKFKGQIYVQATGEMSQKDLEKGGDWYEARLALEKICKEAGLKGEVIPFDQYQGCYAETKVGKIWLGEASDTYILERKDKYVEDLSEEQIIAILVMFK